MAQHTYPHYATEHGYLTDNLKQQYIKRSVDTHLLPENAHRISAIVSLNASNDVSQPIQFWQLYSVLGSERIVALVRKFYQLVFSDELWFSSVFSRIASLEHHVNTQAAMWVDAMGGGKAYHGGEYRLNFHHTHNAMELMNEKGAKRWIELMVKTLNDPTLDLTDDPRVRPAINTFLNFFMGKYESDFQFSAVETFGQLNPAVKRRINFLKMSSEEVEALDIADLKDALTARGIDISQLADKQALVNKALSL